MATKVSQATIDKIKKMGMAAALKSAGKNPIVGGSSSSAADKAQMEFVEGVKRMYGAKRLDAAIGSSRPSTTRAQSANPKNASVSRIVATSGPMSANTGRRRATSGPMSANSPAVSNRSAAAPAKKAAAPKKRQSDAEKLVGGVKRVLNSSPGAGISSPKKKAPTAKSVKKSTAGYRSALNK